MCFKSEPIHIKIGQSFKFIVTGKVNVDITSKVIDYVNSRYYGTSMDKDGNKNNIYDPKSINRDKVPTSSMRQFIKIEESSINVLETTNFSEMSQTFVVPQNLMDCYESLKKHRYFNSVRKNREQNSLHDDMVITQL